MFFIKKSTSLALTLLLFTIVSFSGCSESNHDDDSDDNSRNYMVGVGPIWRNFPSVTYENIHDMMLHFSESGEVMLAQTLWRDSKETSGSVPQFINDLVMVWPNLFGVKYKGISYGINFFKDNPDGSISAEIEAGSGPNDWTNTVAREKYLQVADLLCNEYKARYLALAIEVNRYYWYGYKDDYHRFVDYYKTVYDTLKAKYPDANIFVTFQLEHLNGLGSRMWGYPVEPHWNFLDDFDGKLDVLAFTTYPEVEYDSPSDIPDNYYRNIAEKLPSNLRKKPVAIVETAWSDVVSQDHQVAFLRRFCKLIEGMNIIYINWVHMHDLEASSGNPMTSLGLRAWDGSEKSVWHEWLNLFEKAYRE